jgi:hypothetical protein
MKKSIFTTLAVAALMYVGQMAMACGSHMSVSNTGSQDAGCIFNVNVGVDSLLTGAESNTPTFDSTLATDIAASLNGDAPGMAVNLSGTSLAGWGGGENDIAFTIPTGAQEVVITVKDANGGTSSVTDVLVNGKFEPASQAPGVDPCAAGTQNPPPPATTNTGDPGPQEQAAALDANEGAKIGKADGVLGNGGNTKTVE